MVRSLIKDDMPIYAQSVTTLSTQYQVIAERNGQFNIKEGNDKIGTVEAYITHRSHYFKGPLVQEIAPNSVDRFKIKVDLFFMKDTHNNIELDITYNLKNISDTISKEVGFSSTSIDQNI